ncbi:MAG TPA: hypothetical protein VFO66_11950 [Gemmatimonadaceae bacterium]|nr:hypothetical protein [Gemmatimonadaceae bacterium]
MRRPLGAIAAALLFGATAAGAQQQPAAAQPPLPIPAVGDMAPDIPIRGATRYGLLGERLMLSQLRGQTVVLAFFVVARTRG